jgi:RNA polymerase sigma factor (sigma-70 family)
MTARPEQLLRHLRRFVSGPAPAPASDAALLDRFVRQRDESAFATLVSRHASMVFGVCRRLLRDAHEAEDVFQAVWLVLARKAPSIRHPETLPAWLYGTAHRLASKCRQAENRRRRRETRSVAGGATPGEPDPLADSSAREVLQILDEELQSLPEVYRLPLILCCLEGCSQEEAAARLGWTPGSVRGRLVRGRDRLHARLVRRGLTLTAALAVLEVSQGVVAAGLSAEKVRQVVTAASGVRGLSPNAIALAEEAIRGTPATRWTIGLGLLVALAATGVGALVYRTSFLEQPDHAPAVRNASEAEQPKPAAAAERARTDRNGDPLPAGAVERLGTLRFRSPHTIFFLSFTNDGKALIGVNWENTFHIWDRATGRPLQRVVLQDEWRNSVAVSPDGRLLAAGGRNKDRRIRLWDSATGRQVFESAPQAALIDWLHFTPDGKTLVSLSAGVLHFHDVLTKRDVRQVPLPAGTVKRSALSPDARTLATVTEDHAIHLWDLATGQERHVLHGHRDFLYAVAFAPDGKILASSGADKDRTIRLWDVASGKELHRLPGPAGWVRPLVFAPDGKTFASGGQDGRVRLWDTATGKELKQFLMPGHDDKWGPWVMTLAFTPDGKTLASAGTERVVRLWDVVGGKEVSTPSGHADGVASVAFAPDGRTVVTASSDKTVRTWDRATGQELRRFGDLGGGYSSARFSPDGRVLAAVGPQKTIYLWNPATGQELRQIPIPRGNLASIAFSPDSKTLASVGGREDGTVYLWDVATGKPVREIFVNRQGVPHVVFSPDGRLLAVGAGYGAAALFEVGTGKEVGKLPLEPGYTGQLAFSPDGRLLAVGSGDSVFLFEMATRREVGRLRGHERWVQSIAFAPDGRSLATASQDLTVRVQDVVTGREVRRFTGHLGLGYLGGVVSVAFAPDGRTVATAGDDTTVLVWDVTGLAGERARPAGALRPGDLEALWADLGGEDAPKAHRAVWTLVAAPGQAVPYVAGRLGPVVPADAGRVARLIRDLDSEQFPVRERASEELGKLGMAAGPALRKALADGPSPEARRRIHQLLDRLQARTPERIGLHRALQVLEQIGTADAQRVVARFARETPDETLAREARDTLERLARRGTVAP